jgi:S1-C subfamily serine protease
MKPDDLVSEAQRVLGDLDSVTEVLERDTEQVFSHVVSSKSERAGVKAIVGADPEETEALLAHERQMQRAKFHDRGRSAVRKIKDEGESAALDPEERVATEAIINVLGRPAILIQDGKFFPPPHPWEELESRRAPIESIFPSIGRIDVSGHPALDWVGTGFLVAGDVIMTNRHVAKEFCTGGDGKWTFEAGMTGRVDYREEFGSAMKSEFEITEIIGVHEALDMALFRVALESEDGTAPPPLTLADIPPSSFADHRVYVIGYPASDSKRNNPEIMESVLSGIYNVKRLQPGEIRTVMESDRVFTHDCSTLGGNSGSCVVDLDSNLVVGLHFSGRYLKANYALCLWMLQQDPLITRAGVQFSH